MKNTAIKFGLLGGGVLVVYQFLLYLGGVEWMMKLPLALMTYIIIIALMTLATLRRKNLMGNAIKLPNAFKTAFVTGAILISMVAIYNFALYSLDSDVKNELRDYAKDLFVEIKLEQGLEMDKIDALVAERDAEFEQTSTLKSVVSQWVLDIVIVGILSIIIALVFKTPMRLQNPSTDD